MLLFWLCLVPKKKKGCCESKKRCIGVSVSVLLLLALLGVAIWLGGILWSLNSVIKTCELSYLNLLYLHVKLSYLQYFCALVVLRVIIYLFSFAHFCVCWYLKTVWSINSVIKCHYQYITHYFATINKNGMELYEFFYFHRDLLALTKCFLCVVRYMRCSLWKSFMLTGVRINSCWSLLSEMESQF